MGGVFGMLEFETALAEVSDKGNHALFMLAL
jgi:hypothetical protein